VLASWRPNSFCAARSGAIPLVATLAIAAVAPVGAAQPPAPGGPIVEVIAFERWDFGGPGPYRIEFHADGRAERVDIAQERQGRPERRFDARIEVLEFARLCHLVEAAGFFDLDDVYRDPQLADGVRTVTRVTRGGTEKSVSNANHSGPARLSRLEEALGELAGRLAWKPQRRPQ
jgi:hypothetical protein